MASEQKIIPTEQKYEILSQKFNIPADEIKALHTVAFPDLWVDSFIVAMQVAQQYDLDPRIKEIWWWKDSRGKIVIIWSDAGFRKIARKQPWYQQLITNAVYPDDDFEIDLLASEVKKHIPKPAKTWTNPLGAYAILRMNGKPDQVKWVRWDEYYVETQYQSPWKKQKSAMICKCATSTLCRDAFWLSGLYGEAEIVPDTQEDRSIRKPDLSKLMQIPDVHEVSEEDDPAMESIEMKDQ